MEILINIVDRVTNRWNLSLVNWKFYELCCNIEANRFRIRLIDVRKFDYKIVINGFNLMRSFLRSMMTGRSLIQL